LERIAANRERERERERDIDWVIKGFPLTRGSWCKKLKIDYLRFPDSESTVVQLGIENGSVGFNQAEFSPRPSEQGAVTNTVQYLGIAADEPIRIERHTRPGVILPLVLAGWDEAFCRQLCKELDLLSPIYTDSARGGCWFCHNQGVEQLRLLRRNYPDLWALLLKWDDDSPVTFHSDGHTVHHFDLRFQAEDEGRIPIDRKFRWKMLNL